ncbi:MAG: hypothetical protein L0H43_11855 [Brevibacterium aurantiacum]|nr:hypothetical protein [Brevibacterium aurantiacum]
MRTDTQAQIDDSAISPVFARTYTVDQTTSPSLYECVRLVVVRSGSAILSTKAGKIAVGEGNVILVGPNAKCGYSPESSLTVSTVFLNTKYFFDQVFWQLAGAVRCRQDAHGLAAATFVDIVHSMGIGQHRIGLLTPWLDELVSLSVDNVAGRSFPRVQALWYSILDIIMPFVPKVHMDTGSSFPVEAASATSTGQNFSSIRDEAATVHEMMGTDARIGPDQTRVPIVDADRCRCSTAEHVHAGWKVHVQGLGTLATSSSGRCHTFHDRGEEYAFMLTLTIALREGHHGT